MFQVGDRAPLFTFPLISGLPVDMRRQTTVLAFLRPLTGSQPRVAVNKLQEAWPRFDAAGMSVVGLTRTSLEFARDFVPRYHVLFPMVCDTAGEYFDAYQVARDKGYLGTLKGMRPAALRTAVENLNLGRSGPQLPSDTLPAFFVVATDGTVKYARYATAITEQPDIEALWAASAP
jgi:peroxiredoxin